MLRISFVLLTLLICSEQAEIFDIDLDLAPSKRYTSLASQKKELIVDFILYLNRTSQRFSQAFASVQSLYDQSPEKLQENLGFEFYEECRSVSQAVSLPISNIIVFNFMYELGSIVDFCTSITISSKDQIFLQRNLDYGFQTYLANNSIHMRYLSRGEVMFESICHAGMVGTHTAFKRSTKGEGYQYAITLNERKIRKTTVRIEELIESKCQRNMYTLINTMKYFKGDTNAVVQHLSQVDTCAACYYILIGQAGESNVIEKNRGPSVHSIRPQSVSKEVKYIVQTNHDSDVPDPDNRDTAATDKLRSVIDIKEEVIPSDVWKILLQKPNFNSQTLMSAVLNVKTGEVHFKIWSQSS